MTSSVRCQCGPDGWKVTRQCLTPIVLKIKQNELNKLCFWTLSIVWCLKNKQN